MQSPYLKELPQGCCPTPLFTTSSPEPLNKFSKSSESTSALCRRDFAAATSTSIFPDTQFTNHESIPSLQQSLIEFKKAYPQFADTKRVDLIRAQEYYHLSLSQHTCLDYFGIGLFSYHQLHEQDTLSRYEIEPACLPPSSTNQAVEIPFFTVSYKAGSLQTQLLYGGQESELETAMKKRIMEFMNISENDYSMVFTANRTSAFKLVAESYPFQSSQKLLTVYDYESEAVEAMIGTAEKRGGRAMSAEFTWPRLRIHSAKLRKMVVRKKKKKTKRGLFVFPIHSRISGVRYPYQWMRIAQENGWHTLIDACALGPKDMDSFALSLFRPDFLVCSFYKIFGDNPSGFGCLFVKKSTVPILEGEISSGMVSILPVTTPGFKIQDNQLAASKSFSGKLERGETSGVKKPNVNGKPEEANLKQKPNVNGKSEETKLSKVLKLGTLAECIEKGDTAASFVIGTLEEYIEKYDTKTCTEKCDTKTEVEHRNAEIKCKGLDQVDSLGLTMVTCRARYLINWLVNALMKLKHPNTENVSLVKIYGPKIKFDRGPALAFNVFDWKGEKVEPVLVQKLADRKNISISYGFLHQIVFLDKYQKEKDQVIERKASAEEKRRDSKSDHMGITVVTASLGFLANFEDVYRLWSFVAQFLDADFVEKARWRYTALNQKTIEV